MNKQFVEEQLTSKDILDCVWDILTPSQRMVAFGFLGPEDGTETKED